MKSVATTKSIFPVPWWSPYGGGPEPKSLAEWSIIDIVSTIRQKPQWKEKYKDAVIFDKWVSEVKDQIPDKVVESIGGQDSLPQLFDHIKSKLGWYEKLPQSFEKFEKFDIEFSDKVCSSSDIVPGETQKSVKKLCEELESSFEEVDYHPRSNNQVIDLVHPSLYPLQYGLTPVVKDGKVEIAAYDAKRIANVKSGVDSYGVSELYQWIPSVFERSDSTYKIGSYINNLHPKHFASLYTEIESIFNMVIPGVDFVLSRYAAGDGLAIEYPKYDSLYNEEYHDIQRKFWAEENYDDDVWEKLEASKPQYIKPLDVRFKEPKSVDFKLKEFPELKVIVKLANIELTPENPKYEGGSWHIEGCINEDIVATVLYYYDVENITESKLSFRMAFDDPEYEQNDEFYCDFLFGLKDEGSMTRNIGSVTAEDNKVVIFPNGFQHHVDGFELKDKSVRGHRKILCFFIVDPYNDVVISTKDVPPQQRDQEWQALVEKDVKESIEKLKTEEVKKDSEKKSGIKNSEQKDLKDEMKALSMEDDWPMSLQQAKKVREQLMDERSTSNFKKYDEDFYPYTKGFSLCEH